MTTNLFLSSLGAVCCLLLIALCIPILGVIFTAFDMLIIKRRTKEIKRKLNKIMSIEVEMLKDFSNGKFITGIELNEELSKAEEDILKTIEEMQKET